MIFLNRSKNKKLLSQIIKKERKKFCRFDKKNYFKALFFEVYTPTPRSFFLVFILSGIFFVIAHYLEQIFAWFHLDPYSFLTLQILSQENNHYQNLITIHAGIGVIIFALIIFIAESLRDDKTKDKARVLLKESHLFPLAVAEILVFFIFIWGDVNFLIILPVIFVGLFTIFSLFKIVFVLLDRYRFAQKRAELLQEILKRSIDLAIDERIGNNILLSKLNIEDIKLEYSPSLIDNRAGYHCFQAEKFGIVSDINLQALERLANIVDKEGQESGFSFGSGNRPQVRADRENETEEAKSTSTTENNQRYLMKRFYGVVDEKAPTLICLDKKLITNTSKLKKIKALTKSALIIKTADNFAKKVRYEISGVKDQFISAIENKRLGEMEELVSLYIKLAEGFLDIITKCGGGHSAKQARKERHESLSGWKEVLWLSSDIRYLLEQAIQSHDREIIRIVSYLPIAIARQAINKQDHYLFQEFIWFVELLYLHALKEADDNLKKFLIDRSWRSLKETCGVYVEAKLENAVSEKELESLKDFGIHFFVIYQNLLKKAFDSRDINSFEDFKRASQELFKYFKPSEFVKNAQHIERSLKNTELNEEQKGNLNTLLKNQKTIENIEKDIKANKNQMFFGLASWILAYFVHDKQDKVAKQFYHSIQSAFSSEIKDFTNIFLQACNYNIGEFWGWNWWEMETYAEGEVYSTQITEKLERFYVIKSLTLLADRTGEQVIQIELSYTRDLPNVLIKVLDDIKNNPDNWKFVLTGKAINKADAFKRLLTKSQQTQQQEELKYILKQNISQDRVKQFKDEMIRSFKQNTNIRDIFIHLNAYKKNIKICSFKQKINIRNIFNYFNLYKKNIKKGTDHNKRFGINIVDDKASFFDNWHVTYVGWADNYGSSLASYEDYYLLDSIAKDCEQIDIEDFETTLAKFKNPNDIIIFATDVVLWKFFEPSQNFKPKWRSDTNQLEITSFSGWYEFRGKSIPVFETNHRKIDNQILILSKSKIGRLIQLSPLNKDEKGKVDYIFYINIQAFSENTELLEKFIQKPPQWLQSIKSKQKQSEYLQQRVRIQIFEKLEYNKPDDFKGYKLFIKEK